MTKFMLFHPLYRHCELAALTKSG